jgi:hypothetical protein
MRFDKQRSIRRGGHGVKLRSGLAQRLAALGPTTGLPEPLRLALEPGDDFEPIHEPGPSDWLGNYAEAGQTFEY